MTDVGVMLLMVKGKTTSIYTKNSLKQYIKLMIGSLISS